MATVRSDTASNEQQSDKTTVREFPRKNGEVASKDEIRTDTDVPAWYIDHIASTDEFYTSINHNGAYVASKYIVGPDVGPAAPSSELILNVQQGIPYWPTSNLVKRKQARGRVL